MPQGRPAHQGPRADFPIRLPSGGAATTGNRPHIKPTHADDRTIVMLGEILASHCHGTVR